MKMKYCPVCKSKIYEIDNDGKSGVESKKTTKKTKKKDYPIRTSTPISEVEENTTSSFSDSVTEFFYQSWKSGLHLNDTTKSQVQYDWYYVQVPQPVSCTTHLVYVNTVVYQPYVPFSWDSYSPQVGYRPDGTFGILPPSWQYRAN